MTKLKLVALMYSVDEYLEISSWSKDHRELFEVTMPSGIACAPLTHAIYLPDILNSGIDGVLIANHLRYSDKQIGTVVRQLRVRDKRFYSVVNGIVPVGANDSATNSDHTVFADTPILKVLSESRCVLRWLNKNEPTATIPRDYVAPIKRLENLGFVFRRNNKMYSLRRHRLQKVLEHESKKLTAPYKIEDLLHA